MHGFDVVRNRRPDGTLIPENRRWVFESNYGYDTEDEARDAAIRRCNEIGPDYIYRLFNR